MKLRVTAKDFDQETLIDPDSNEAKVYNPAGSLKKTFPTGEIVQETEGKWYCLYDIPDEAASIGEWWVVWKATKGSKPSIAKKFFTVERLS